MCIRDRITVGTKNSGNDNIEHVYFVVHARDKYLALKRIADVNPCLLYTSDAADERSSVDLGGRRIIKKKNNIEHRRRRSLTVKQRYKTDMRDQQAR